MLIHISTAGPDYFVHQHEIRQLGYSNLEVIISLVDGSNAYITPLPGSATPNTRDLYTVIIDAVFENSNVYVDASKFRMEN